MAGELRLLKYTEHWSEACFGETAAKNTVLRRFHEKGS